MYNIFKKFKFNLGLIGKCQYEFEVLKSTEKVLHVDLHCQLSDAIDAAKRGVPNPVICFSCKQKIIMEPMLVFRCVFNLCTTIFIFLPYSI